MQSRRVLLAGLGSAHLAASVLALESRAVVAETEAEAHQRLKLQSASLGEWAPKPTHKPKKGKPTKAEKKAAKRARTRGVMASQQAKPDPRTDPVNARLFPELYDWSEKPTAGVARAGHEENRHG